MAFFDEQSWRSILHKPDWYLRLADELQALQDIGKRSDKKTAQEIGNAIYDFFETHLADGSIALGTNGHEEDGERKPIDTIVIHHTSSTPGMTIERLNAMHLLRLYVPVFVKRAKSGAPKPIVSGHIRNGRQMFYAYHWLIRSDGSVERLLNDSEIGWQAGDWETNCRSIAICFDDNLTEKIPTPDALASVKMILQKHYPHIQREHLFGHREINPKTSCPGERYLGGWGEELRGVLRVLR